MKSLINTYIIYFIFYLSNGSVVDGFTSHSKFLSLSRIRPTKHSSSNCDSLHRYALHPLSMAKRRTTISKKGGSRGPDDSESKENTSSSGDEEGRWAGQMDTLVIKRR